MAPARQGIHDIEGDFFYLTAGTPVAKLKDHAFEKLVQLMLLQPFRR